MTTNDAFGRTLSAWLHEDAEHHVPDHLDEVLERSAVTRQRPAWSSLERWLPMDLTTRVSAFTLPRPGRVLLIAVLLLALVGLAVFAVGSRQQRLPAPFGPAANGWISSWSDGDIYLSEPDGSQSRAVVTGPTDDLAPLFSRDGTRFAFLRQTAPDQMQLMLAAADGSDVRPILDTPLTSPDWLEWSPTDDRMAVVHTLDGKRVLSIVDVEAGTLQTLGLGGLEVDNDVYWRPPNGTELLFTARPVAGEPDRVGIYSIRPDGSGLTRIAPFQTGPAVYLGLDVSPDGSTLSYWNWEDDDSPDGKGSHIHLLDIASGVDQRVTFDPTSGGETAMRYLPDYTHVILGREDASVGQLMVAPSDRSEPGRLIGPKFSVRSEVGWGISPDGATIFLVVNDAEPVFIDVATGEVKTGPDPLGACCGWQRRAP